MTTVDEAFAEFLEGDEIDFEAFCNAHPEVADELRRLYEQYQQFRNRESEIGGFFDEEKSDDHGSDSGLPPNFEDLLERLRRHRRIAGRYELHGEIARGGMGAILRVRDDELDRDLAMKVILGQSPAATGETPPVDSRVLARFLDEAQVTGQLDHPGIVPVHELGIDDQGRVYFTMRLVKGRDLKEVFRLIREGAEDWNEARALGMILKACEAVAYAHSKGVIHRDLKPGNIMVGRFGEVYVMDWGLARVQGRGDTRNLRLRPDAGSSARSLHTLRRLEAEETPDSPLVTMDGHVVGTPSYMSPEQARGELDRLGPRSDVYSMGAMLYDLLAGHSPYDVPGARKSARTILSNVLDGPPKPLRQIRKDVSVELEAICEKAMAREVEDRYGSVVELADDLRAFLEGRVVRAYRTGALAELGKWVRRNRTLAAVGLTAMVAVVVLAGWALWSADQAREEVLRLSISQDYENLMAEAAELWPVHWEEIDAYREWIATAEKLVKRLPELEATRAELRREATPRTEGDRGEWSFPEEQSQSRWWDKQLTKLIGELESLTTPGTGLLTEDGWSADRGWSMPQRVAVAEQFAEGEFAERWKKALPVINAAYPDLDLAMQADLVPIGVDPDSKLWEFWHRWSGTEPLRGEDGKLAMKESSGLVFVLLPGGEFWMGAQKEDPDVQNFDPNASGDEGPVHEVELSAFFLSKYEMTQGQWERLGGRNRSLNLGGSRAQTLLYPVEMVTWDECTALLSNLGLMLPSEAQWEYGARGGTETPWWTGSDEESLSVVEAVPDGDHWRLGGPATVGTYPSNGFGLHEVIGSVWEWCRDGYDGSFYGQSPVLDPVSRPEGSRPRVYRGGSFSYPAVLARSAYRDGGTPAGAGSTLGLRPARARD